MATTSQETATKFCGMSGHIPNKVRLEIQKNYLGAEAPNAEYFDIDHNCKTQDWKKLGLPYAKEKTPIASMFAPKKSRRDNSDKDVFIDNYPVKVKLASASQFAIYQGGTKESLQVLLPQGYIVGITADVFFEALMRDGMDNATKELNSEFIIATLNRTTRLIRVGSDLHEAVKERQIADKRPKLDVKTMSVGQVFETNAGSKALFLGFVTSTYIKPTLGRNEDNEVIKAEAKYSTMKISTLWQPLGWGYDTSNNKALQKDFVRRMKDEYSWGEITLKTKSGHGYIKRCPKLYVDVPNDMIRSVRLRAIKSVTDDLKRYGNQDCSKFAAWIKKAEKYQADNPDETYEDHWEKIRERDRKERESGGWRGGTRRATPDNSFYAPDWYSIQSLFKDNKRTNMTVFGMQPEPHETSRKIEKLLELFTEMHEKGLEQYQGWQIQ